MMKKWRNTHVKATAWKGGESLELLVGISLKASLDNSLVKLVQLETPGGIDKSVKHFQARNSGVKSTVAETNSEY